MVDKLKILLVGGDNRQLKDRLLDWLDIVHVDGDQHKIVSKADGIKSVVVMTKFVSRNLMDKARKYAREQGLKMLPVLTGNYVLPELVKVGLLPKEALEGKKKQEPVPEPVSVVEAPKPEPAQEPSPQASSGLTPDQIWAQYGGKAINVVKSAVKPGEKIHEDDLLELFSIPDGVGLPKEDAIHLLPELAVLGMIVNTKGKTWQTPNLDADYDYRTGEQEVEVPDDQDEEVKPVLVEDKQKPSNPFDKHLKKNVGKGRHDLYSKEHWVHLLGGIHPGPYRTQGDIFAEALKYQEFTHKSGIPVKQSYYWVIIPTAIKYGVVEKLPDGTYVVKPDPSVTLTLRESAKDAPKAVPKPAVPSSAKPAIPTGRPPSDPVKLVHRHYGGTVPVLDRFTLPTKVLRKIVPKDHWDELAVTTVGRIVGVREKSQCLQLKDSFDQAEWDRLAFDAIRQMPIEIIVPFLREQTPQDYDLTCIECKEKFIFTVGEQEYMKRMVEQGRFESYDIPKRCKPCREKLRGASRL